jgi:hypothetical protein
MLTLYKSRIINNKNYCVSTFPKNDTKKPKISNPVEHSQTSSRNVLSDEERQKIIDDIRAELIQFHKPIYEQIQKQES